MDQFDREIKLHMIGNIDSYIEHINIGCKKDYYGIYDIYNCDDGSFKTYLFELREYVDVNLPKNLRDYREVLFEVMKYNNDEGRLSYWELFDDTRLIDYYVLIKFDKFIESVFNEYLELDEDENPAKYKGYIREQLALLKERV